MSESKKALVYLDGRLWKREPVPYKTWYVCAVFREKGKWAITLHTLPYIINYSSHWTGTVIILE